MAMTLASPSASPSPSTGDAARTNTNTNVKNESTPPLKDESATNNTTPTDATNTTAAAAASANNAANMKRKPSRRANTAERRATHNAVERQRRETLNGRFLDLAQLLPNLSQIRRPSKSSIVNSSIAHIHASRRHRMLASRELRQIKAEADALRREVNEWRSRQNLPLVDEPVRSDGFNIIVSGELDVLVAEMGAEMAAQGHGNLVGVGGNGAGLMDVEEDEDLDDWGPAPPSSHGGPPPPHAGGYPAGQYDEEVFVPQAPIHPQQQHPVHHQGMMMNGHHGHHPQHPMHHHPQQHVQQQHPHHMQQQQQQQQFGYHPSQGPQPFAPGSLEDDRHFLKTGGNPFAHNITNTRSYDSPTQGPGAGALFTPPATRDGLPPNGVAGLTSSKPININTNVGGGGGGGVVNGGASPAQSVQSVHSAHSPASHHSGIALGVNGELGGTPPPPSAISQHFSQRSGSGSPVGYELASSNGGPGGAGPPQPPMERRATYPGPGPAMMYGGNEMYGQGHGGHPMHEMRGGPHGGGGHEMRGGGGGHDMRGMEMRHHHHHHPMQGHGHGHDMRGGEMRHGAPTMVGAGGGGGGLFGMML